MPANIFESLFGMLHSQLVILSAMETDYYRDEKPQLSSLFEMTRYVDDYLEDSFFSLEQFAQKAWGQRPGLKNISNKLQEWLKNYQGIPFSKRIAELMNVVDSKSEDEYLGIIRTTKQHTEDLKAILNKAGVILSQWQDLNSLSKMLEKYPVTPSPPSPPSHKIENVIDRINNLKEAMASNTRILERFKSKQTEIYILKFNKILNQLFQDQFTTSWGDFYGTLKQDNPTLVEAKPDSKEEPIDNPEEEESIANKSLPAEVELMVLRSSAAAAPVSRSPPDAASISALIDSKSQDAEKTKEKAAKVDMLSQNIPIPPRFER